MKPVLVMSSERSGSNLLRRMLGAHSRVAAPPPPHLWRHLARMAAWLGPLDDDANLRPLVQAALRMTRVPGSHLAWRHAIPEEEVLAHLTVRSLSGVCGALYAAYAAREGADVWVCKENLLFDHALAIRAAFPETRVVYLCRDGRDYACSVRRVPAHGSRVFCIAEEWRDEQRRCLLVHHELRPHGAVSLLRYEDLVTTPEPALRALCEFVDIPFEAAMLRAHERPDAAAEASATVYWRNLGRPVLADNHGKFRRELTRREIALFEAVAGPELEVLGYPLVTAPRRIRAVERLGYRLADRLAQRLARRRLLREPGRREREAMLLELEATAAAARGRLAGALR